MTDYESIKGKFQILYTFLTFWQICGAQPETMVYKKFLILYMKYIPYFMKVCGAQPVIMADYILGYF